jgi:hypothetical protein
VTTRLLARLAILLTLTSTTHSQPAQACTARTLPTKPLASQLDLPKESQITQVWSCKDTSGEQLVVAALAHASGQTHGEELLFLKYTQTSNGWKKNWQARDFLNDATSASLPPTEHVLLQDVDGDGLAEVFIAYSLPGQAAALDEGKLLVYYKDHKYAIRGAIARTPNDFGSRKIPASFLTLPPAIQNQALKLWDKLTTPHR